jgi:hypothetical protein
MQTQASPRVPVQRLEISISTSWVPPKYFYVGQKKQVSGTNIGLNRSPKFVRTNQLSGQILGESLTLVNQSFGGKISVFSPRASPKFCCAATSGLRILKRVQRRAKTAKKVGDPPTPRLVHP